MTLENTSRVDKLRWLTVLLQILVGTSTAYVYCLAVYIGPLAGTFGWDPAVIVVAYTAMMIVSLPGSVVGGKMREKWGNRTVLKVGGIAFAAFVVASSFSTSAWMYVILSGGCASFCMYVVYVAQLANIGELFPDRRGFAMGIVIGGISLGTALLSPLAEWLTRVMDLMHGIALQGIVYGGLAVLVGFIMVEAPKDYRPKGWQPEEIEVIDAEKSAAVGETIDVNWKKMLTMPAFWVLFIGILLANVFGAGVQSNASLMAQNALGVDPQIAAWVYAFLMIAAGVGGFALGWQSDKFTGPSRTMAYWYILTAIVAAIFVVLGANDFWMFMVVMAVLGLACGAVLSLLPTITMDAFGNRQFGVNYGVIMCAPTIGSIIGPQLTISLNISQYFTMGIAVCAAGGVFILLAGKMLNKALGMKKF